MKKLKRLLFDAWCLIPFGYLLRFDYGGAPNSRQRVTLRKDLWIIVDGGKGTATDALPLSMVSQNLVDECERRLIDKYGLEPVEA